MSDIQIVPVDTDSKANIKVIGLGGGGGNAVDYMAQFGIEGVEFICANTDAQALKDKCIKNSLQIGGNITRGLGAGADPEKGRQAALEDRERIQEILQGADMVFLAAGMGGGTGTGAIPVVAQIARDMDILTVAVVTKPFPFEQSKRMKIAEQGVAELREHVDSLIVIPNERLLSSLGKVTMRDAMSAANDVLRGAVQGVSDIIVRPGLINVDFADVKTVMTDMGLAMMGTGVGRGDNRAREAAECAVRSPLLSDVSLRGARGILVNITANEDMGIDEYQEIGDLMQEYADEDSTVIIGTVFDPDVKDEIRVTVVATGLSEQTQSQVQPQATTTRATPGLRQSQKPEVVANNALPQRPSKAQSSQALGPADYQNLDKPAIMRQRQQRQVVNAEPVQVTETSNVEYLDIPTFLRRQAD